MQSGSKISQILEIGVTYKTSKNITKKRILPWIKNNTKTNSCKMESVTKAIRRYAPIVFRSKYGVM